MRDPGRSLLVEPTCAMDHFDEASSLDPAHLEARAMAIKVKSGRKKGKKFASSDFMLRLVDQVNRVQEEKVQAKLEYEVMKHPPTCI